jgi:hypothetical protein
MKKNSVINLLCAVLFLTGNLLMAKPAVTNDEKAVGAERARILPFGSEWAKKKGIDLPSPFGISTFFTNMARSVDVTDVTIQLNEREPESISEFSSFAVKNKTFVSAIKLDAWVLPVLNVYVLGGYAWTDAKMNVDISIDRQILPLPPVEMNFQTSTMVKGPYTGIGTTLVAGYKSWFILGDANYGLTWADLLNNSINFTMLSVRSGFSGKMGGKNAIRGWLGAMYMNSKCTLEILANSDVIGDVMIRVEQRPVNPWTIQCGFMVNAGDHFEFMTELGSNFDDASIFVLTASYRF